MRRMSLVSLALLVLVVVLTPERPLSAEAQDPTVTTARQLMAQGSYEAAITMLRDALEGRRADLALRQTLAEALEMKQDVLNAQLRAVADEITALRAMPASQACDGRAPVRVGNGIKAPIKTFDVHASYPVDAMRARVEGVTVLEIIVGCSGEVTDVRVLRGNPVLDPAAVDAVRQWRYTPTLLNGQPLPVILTVTVTFSVRG